VALLVLFWALAFKSSFLLHSSQEDLIYAVCYTISLCMSFTQSTKVWFFIFEVLQRIGFYFPFFYDRFFILY